MLQRRFVPLAISVYLLIVQLFNIECRPHIQKVLVQDHEWTVPDEPGWEDSKIILRIFLMKNTLISSNSSSRS